MLNPMEELMRLHPVYGGRERHPSHLDAFETLESRHLCSRREYEPDRSAPSWAIGEVGAAAAMLLLFIGVLTAIARLAGDASQAGNPPQVAISTVAETR